MTAQPLRIVPADEKQLGYAEALDASKRAGKHIGDELRAEIAGRDWARVHIAGDRRGAVEIERVRRGWR